MIGLIAAKDPNNVIGADNKLIWHYKEDLKRFKKLTINCILIMGENTFLSLPKLSNRLLIVLSNKTFDDAISATSWDIALDIASSKLKDYNKPIWIIGGGQIYKEAIENQIPDFLDITIVPQVDLSDYYKVIYFPKNFTDYYQISTWEMNQENKSLQNITYTRK